MGITSEWPRTDFLRVSSTACCSPIENSCAVTVVEFRIAQQDEERQNREYFASLGAEGMDTDESDVDQTYGIADFEEDMYEAESEDMEDDDFMSNSKMWSTI